MRHDYSQLLLLHAFFSCDQYSIFSARDKNCLRDGTKLVHHIVAIIFYCSVITEFDLFHFKGIVSKDPEDPYSKPEVSMQI